MNNTTESRQKAAHATPDVRQGALPVDCVETITLAEVCDFRTIYETANYRPGPVYRPTGPGLCPSCGSGNVYRAGYTINGSYRQRYSCRDCDFSFWQLEK